MDISARFTRAVDALTAVGQEHVLRFFDELDANGKVALLDQIDALDLTGIARLFTRAQSGNKGEHIPTEYSPPPRTAQLSDPEAGTWADAGRAAVAAGRVGAVLLAGGQGTRLGSSAPKGCYDIGLPSRKSLFQLFAERILCLQRVCGDVGVVPLYVMTSPQTHAETVAFFAAHGHFGLAAANVLFFTQGTLPCLTGEGKLILDGKGVIASSPDGNGGIYEALARGGCLADMARRGVTHVHAFSVDNCLVKVADPTFVGFALTTGVEIANKVIAKASPTEAVGVLASPRAGPASRLFVVEYSELPVAEATAVGPSGVLAFNAANICNHVFSVAFLTRAVAELVPQLYHHVARKSIPCIDATGARATVAGIKLELFIFDVLPLASANALEVAREDEFSPLKNALSAPTDNALTSRLAVAALHRKWAAAAGATFVHADGPGLFEISPLCSYAGEGLALDGAVFSARVHTQLS